MPCESCADEAGDLHPDLAHLAATIGDRTAGPLTVALAELAGVMAEARNVRVVPSDRLAVLTTAVPQDRATQLVGFQPDRLRVTITNTGTGVVSIGRDESVTDTAIGRYDLANGATLQLDTRAELWGYAAGADAELSIIAEETDA